MQYTNLNLYALKKITCTTSCILMNLFSCVMQRAEEAAVIVQAESDTGKASMYHEGGRGAQSVRSSGIGQCPGQEFQHELHAA